MVCISHYFKVRICTEINTPSEDDFTVLTNATMGQVFNTIMDANTNYVWRYNEQTDAIYVHPKTNAISMMPCDKISVTNMSVKTLFAETDIWGVEGVKINLKGERKKNPGIEPWYWSDETVTLDFEEGAYVWQILDEIDSQLTNGWFWSIASDPQSSDCRVYFSHSFTNVLQKP